MKKMKFVQSDVQDTIGRLMSNGITLEVILGLGYVVPVKQDVKTMPVERKESLHLMTEFLKVSISEVLKSPEERSMEKLIHFLKMALVQSDLFCKGMKNDEFLFHSLSPDFD